MSRKEVIEKLRNLGSQILEMINRGENPYIEIPVRSLSNIVWDEKSGLLRLGESKAKRYFFHVGHARKFMQTMLVAAFCEDLLDENIHASIRDMYYNLKRTLPGTKENTFDEQAESNPIIVDLETSLDVLREQLHLIADRKGVVAGNVVIEDRGDEIDWSKLGSGGWSIPSAVEDIKFKHVDADFVLCLPSFEEIFVNVNGRLASLPIKDVYELYRKGENVLVVSYDDEMRPIFSRIVFMIKRKSRPGEKLYRIESKSGSSIFVSENHKVPVVTPDGIKTKPAKEVKADEYVLEAKDLSILSKPFKVKVDLIDFLIKRYPEKLNRVRVYGSAVRELLKDVKVRWWRDEGDGLYQELVNSWKKYCSMPLTYYIKFERDKEMRNRLRLYFTGSPRKNSVPAILEVNKDFARILGYYIAEGHVSNGIAFWTFGRHEKELRDELIELIKNVFKIEPKVYRDNGRYSSIQIMCGNKVVGLLLKELCGDKANNKHLPNFVFNCSNDIKKALIECYIKGDGYVYKNLITFSTVSSRLADQVRLLLRLMGIPSYKSVHENNRSFKEYKKLPLIRVDILKDHWNKEKRRDSHSLWNKAPIFLFSGNVTRRSRYGYKMLSVVVNKPKINLAYVHPVAVRKVEKYDYKGDYFELVVVEPAHVFLHSSGIFTHNCVEKNAAFERLHEDKFWKKHHCILIGTGGQASRGTRRLIRRLNKEFNLPVYVMTDADSYGWYIYSVIKAGSMNLAHTSELLGTPDAKFIGLSASDIKEYGLENFTIKATERDIKRAKELLNYPWFKHKEWQKEIKLMIKMGRKAELEALSSKGLRFITNNYLPEKLEKKEFLP